MIMAIKIGAKLVCPKCQSEFIVTKLAANAELKCCGETIQEKQSTPK